jgi:hypothetical protein
MHSGVTGCLERRLVGVGLGDVGQGHELVVPRGDGGELLLGIDAFRKERGESERVPVKRRDGQFGVGLSETGRNGRQTKR